MAKHRKRQRPSRKPKPAQQDNKASERGGATSKDGPDRSTTSRLLNLPVELSDEIYALALGCGTGAIELPLPSHLLNVSHPLLRLLRLSQVNKQIRTEATSVFYNRFVFKIDAFAHTFDP